MCLGGEKCVRIVLDGGDVVAASRTMRERLLHSAVCRRLRCHLAFDVALCGVSRCTCTFPSSNRGPGATFGRRPFFHDPVQSSFQVSLLFALYQSWSARGAHNSDGSLPATNENSQLTREPVHCHTLPATGTPCSDPGPEEEPQGTEWTIHAPSARANSSPGALHLGISVHAGVQVVGRFCMSMNFKIFFHDGVFEEWG